MAEGEETTPIGYVVMALKVGRRQEAGHVLHANGMTITFRSHAIRTLSNLSCSATRGSFATDSFGLCSILRV